MVSEITIENRGKRSFIINPEDHIKGGKVCVGPNGKTASYYIEPDMTVKVTEVCGNRLASNFKKEIRILKKTNRKG